MPSKREPKESYNYTSTACGLLSFIVFFLGAFIAFIAAEETGKYYYYVILLGSAMLCAALVILCGIMNETKNLPIPKPKDSNEPQPEQGLLLQSQPEMSGKSNTAPHWLEKTRFDFAYVRQVLGMPPTDSNEITSSENDSDPDIVELRRMAKYGLPPDVEEPMDVSSQEAEGVSTAGPSKVASKSSEITQSRPDYLPLKDMAALSLSGPSKAASEEKKADVSAALSQLCLDSSDNEVAKLAGYESYSTDSEGKSDDQYVEDSNSSLESKKEA